MPTFMQKIRLAIRGWSRRREERDRELIAKNSWSVGPPPSAVRPEEAPAPHIDMEGIQVAYLDSSGRIEHYLDAETGDVIEATNAQLDSTRFKRIPTASHEDDRHAFLGTVEDGRDRARLASTESFRSVLATDRALERRWYNFRNDRAIEIINRWLREVGVK